MICEKMKNIVNYTKTKFNNDLRKYNITAAQFLVLKYLLKNEGKKISQKEICEYLFLKHTTVNGIMKRLEEKKLIEKQTNHVSNIKITTKGKKLYESIGDYEENIEKHILQKFNSSDIKKLSSMLDLMLEDITDSQKRGDSY